MRHYLWLTIGFCLLGIVIFPLDFLMADQGLVSSLPGDFRRILKLSEVFAHGFGLFVVVLGIWCLVPDKRYFLPRIICCAVLPSLTVQLIKLMVGRSRPISFLQGDDTVAFPTSIHHTWQGMYPAMELNLSYITQSFPSAHTATAWGLAIGLAWVFPRGRNLFFSLAMLASIQRITSLAHWGSDVCFGAAIAFMMAGALTHNWALGYWLGKFERYVEAKMVARRREDQLPIAAGRRAA